MKRLASILLAALAALGLSGAAVAAPAASATCPESGTGIRIFLNDNLSHGWLTECYAYGPGNNPAAFPNYFFIDKEDGAPGSGFVESDFTHTGTLGSALLGTFTVNTASPNLAGFDDFLLVLKSGAGQLDPDWAAFRITGGSGGFSGDWEITTGRQSLSHLSLYGFQSGIPCTENCGEVPLPGTLLLAGAGLFGIGLTRVRKRRMSAYQG